MKYAKGCLVVVVFIAVIGAIASIATRQDDNDPARALVPTFTPLPSIVAPMQLVADVPTVIDLQPAPTNSSVDYRQAVTMHGRELAEGIQSIGELMQDPRLADNDWIMGIGIAIARIQIAHEEIAKLTPPPDLAEFHAALMKATASCNNFATTLSSAIDNRNSDTLITSLSLLQACSAELNQSAQLADGETVVPAATSLPAQPTTVPPAAIPQATANDVANLRGGPGTDFAIVGSVAAGQALTIVGRNAAGDWYQLSDGTWIAAFLVTGAPVDVAVVEVPVVEPIVEQPTAAPIAPVATDTPFIVATVAPAAPCDCSGDTKNCGDFSDHAAARACFDYCMATVGIDIHRLDADGDGLFCED